MLAFRRPSLARLALAAAALGLAAPLAHAQAQSFPSRPIRVIIPFTPGGALDQIVQLVGGKLTEAWGQPVHMDHRPGAGGVIGTAAGAKAAPDGYTLLLGSIGPSSVAPSLYAKLPYDPVKDFAPISLAVTYSNLVLLHPSVPARTMQEFIALAKAKPGQLTFSTSGTGTSGHLAGELLRQMAGIDVLFVHYKGVMPALTDAMSGQVSGTINNIGPTLPHVQSGKLRAIGVSSLKRSPVAPDLPTIAESGVPGYEVITWVGFWAPAGTPKDILAKLHGEIFKALSAKDVQAAFLARGVEAAPSTPEQADAFLKSEIAKWAQVVKTAGIKVE